MNPSSLPYVSIILLATSPLASAQTITATINSLNYTYTGYRSGFQASDVTSTGSSFDLTSGLIFCIDYTTESYWGPNGNGYTEGQSISDEITTIEHSKSWDAFSNNQDQDLAIAQVGWLVDQYYDDRVLGDTDMISTSAFANALWELMHDGGTAEGLNLSNGNFTRSFGGTLGTELNEMINAVKNSGVDASYEWSRPMWVVKSANSDMQDYLFLSAEPVVVTVPEPGSLAMFSLASILGLANRRRAKS